MSDVYGFRGGPSYRVSTPGAVMQNALDTPLSMARTFYDSAIGEAVSSYGLGTAIRDIAIPDGAATPQSVATSAVRLLNPMTAPLESTRLFVQSFREDSPTLDEAKYKASPYYRENIPWDKGMTEARAKALADWDDVRKVREFYAEKRPITAFLGNIAGQALDPINYVPVGGPMVRAAALARAGRVGSAALAGAFDAAANTAMFGIATRDQRARYGDDVSWQATITDIASAALIGTAFGTIGGALEGRGQAKALSDARKSLDTLRTAQEGRIALNEAIDAVVRGEDVKLSPNATEPMARVAREAEPIMRRAGEVDRSWAGAAVEGQSVVTPTGLRIGTRAEIADASTLVKASGDLQPRDRSRAASDAQIAEMAANLDPARLLPSPEADRGAPIVGPDNIVESGNGRVAAIMRAAQTNPERFAAYKQALRDAGYDVPDNGIPILVSRRTSDLTPEQRTQFVADANTSAIARMSATETAMMDVRAMTGAALDNYVPGDVNSAANRPFVGAFVKNLPPNERLALVDAQGRLNADGVRRVENALIAAAYGDNDVIARFAETPDDNVKAIMGAMSDAAGEWAAMRREISQGLIDADFDVTPNLTDALRFMSKAREQALAEKRPVATVIKEGLGQIDLLAGEIDPRTKAFVQAFYKNDQFTQANGRDILAAHLQNIVRSARDLGKPQLFGDATAVKPSEMISNARPQDRQTDLFGAGGSRGGSGENRVGQEVVSLFGTGEANPQGAARQVSDSSLNRTASWVIRDKATGQAVMETFDPKLVERVNTEKYEAVPIGDYLGSINGQPPRAIDKSPARPEPAPTGRKEAEARVTRPDDTKTLAEQHKVNPETGDFPEMAELDQLRAEGRLTAEDEAEIAGAQQTVEDADAYAEALKSVTRCLL